MKILNHFLGTVGSDPVAGTSTPKDTGRPGVPWARFRMAVNHDYLNPETGSFENVDTTWYDVIAYNGVAKHIPFSLKKGDPVLVLGRVRTRNWKTETSAGTNVEIIAEAIGPNIRFGAASIIREGAKKSGEPGALAAENPPLPEAWAKAVRNGIPGDGSGPDGSGVSGGTGFASDPLAGDEPFDGAGTMDSGAVGDSGAEAVDEDGFGLDADENELVSKTG